MKQYKLKVGSRGSSLALAQVEEIQSLLARKGIDVEFRVEIFDTQGDKNRRISLTANLAGNFFTDTLDRALLEKKIDITIHSAKDLPKDFPEGLAVLALTRSIDETDAFVGKTHFNKLKKGARVGTSSPLRQQSIKKLNPDVIACDIRGNIEDRIRQLDAGKYDGIIVATCALKRLGLTHRVSNIMPWEATALQGQLAVVARSNDKRFEEIFKTIDVRRKYGKVFLVGAGPGDKELITLKGINILKKADVIFYDYLVNKELLKFAQRTERIYVGKRKGSHSLAQNQLNRIIREKAMAGKNVVRLKGGDPLIFGRGGDEIDYLRQYHIEVDVIPGVSSATAIPSSLGVPLTARGISDSVAFLSGHREDEINHENKTIKIPNAKTLVFLMGITKLKEIVAQLIKEKWSRQTPAMVISKGTCPDEMIVTGVLADIVNKCAKEKPQPPALIIVGETLRFYRPKLKPTKTILFTGTNPSIYKARGRIVHHAMLQIKSKSLTNKQKQKVIEELRGCDYLLFTSRFAVKYFFDIVRQARISKNIVSSKRVIVIGKATAASLIQEGAQPDLISSDESSQGLFRLMKKNIYLKGKRIFFPRSALENPFLRRALAKEGSKVIELAVYDNIKPPKRPLPAVNIDEIYFTSPSTVKNFLKDYKSIPPQWKVKSRGALTKKFLRQAGYNSEIIS